MTSATNTGPTTIPPTPIVNPLAQPVPTIGVHPAAELFPLMNGPELGALVEDIEQHGLREPIVLYQGLVLDGRNRLRACELARVEPRFVEWDGTGSPLALVLSRNLHRRHLNESQRSIIAARAKGMFEEECAERKRACQFGDSDTPESGDAENSQITVAANLQRPARATAQAADLLNVSERSVSTASRVLERGDEQVIAAVESGEVAVSDARTIVDRPKDEQRQALDAVRQGRARTLRKAAQTEFSEHPAAETTVTDPLPLLAELFKQLIEGLRAIAASDDEHDGPYAESVAHDLEPHYADFVEYLEYRKEWRGAK